MVFHADDSDNPRLPEDDLERVEKVKIPEGKTGAFSFRKLWAFTGPGFLMSIAYLDPGNIESDLRAGALTRYKLLWLLLLAHILGLMLQRVAARLGVVSGSDLAEVCHSHFPRIPRLFIWIMIEIAIIGSDMQEVIGTAIALNLLSGGKIPLWAGVVITIVDTFTFLFLEKYGMRKLELLFGIMITTMAVMFGYEYIVSTPNQVEVLKGLFIPYCADCGQQEILQAVAMVGAIIMPHNFYLHSGLVKSRDVDRSDKHAVKEANLYFFIESSAALFVSFIINLFVVSVFAAGLNGRSDGYLHRLCGNSSVWYSTVFEANSTEIGEVNIFRGGIFLGCRYGVPALYIWAIGILASGQSSTMTGTYSGQIVMEGFLKLKFKRWQRVLLARSVAIVPTVMVAIFKDIGDLTELNDLLNALMCLQLPFAIFPMLTATSSTAIMGDFKNGRLNKIVLGVLSGVLIGVNFFFAVSYVSQLPRHWAIYTAIAVLFLIYTLVILYLSWVCLATMGVTCLRRIPIPKSLQPISLWPDARYEELDSDHAAERTERERGE